MTRDEEWLLKEKWKGEKAEGFFADSARLKLNEPLAYVIGSIPFLNTTIYLDSHPLIPRTETEYWVEQMIQRIQREHNKTPFKILDLCAGSGCIGVSVLKALPHVSVDFAEIDTSHHPIILKNIRENEINEDRTTIIDGDLFEQVLETYDYILSNPPYIDPVINRTEESVSGHEPHLALYGGKDGMELIERIILESKKYLTPLGMLVIEHDPEQTKIVQVYADNADMHATTHRDQFNVERFTCMHRIN